MNEAGRSIGSRAAAIIVALLGFLPWYNWLPTGHDSAGYGWMAAQGMLAAIALIAAVLLAFASERIAWLWREGAATRLASEAERHPRLLALLLAVVVTLAYALVSVAIFGRHPADVDDAVQLLQARAYARGSLWQELGARPEFVASTHDIVRGTRGFAQFPPGHPALLALGVLAGAPWLVVPLLGGVMTYAFARLLRLVEERRTVVWGATLLLPFSPLVLTLGGSYMNAVPVTCALVVAMLGVAHCTMPAPTHRAGWALVAGLGFGVAATIRPVDAVAFALPAGAWLLVRALREPRRWVEALVAGAGVALPIAAMLWVNARTTGHPLLMGYSALWGE